MRKLCTRRGNFFATVAGEGAGYSSVVEDFHSTLPTEGRPPRATVYNTWTTTGRQPRQDRITQVDPTPSNVSARVDLPRPVTPCSAHARQTAAMTTTLAGQASASSSIVPAPPAACPCGALQSVLCRGRARVRGRVASSRLSRQIVTRRGAWHTIRRARHGFRSRTPSHLRAR